MLHMKSRIILFVLAIVIGVTAHAYDFAAKNSDGVDIYYNITSESEKTVRVTVKSTYFGDEYKGAINIPSTVVNNGVTYKVTSIMPQAFNGNEYVTAVSIPNSVTIIESLSFSGCSNLQSITIPNSVTTIRSGAFSGCTSLQQITIPEYVTELKEEILYGCSNLSTVYYNAISASDLKGNGVFGLSSALSPNLSIILGNKVQRIPKFLLANATTLKSINITNSVTEIGAGAFANCPSLAEFNGKFASEDHKCLIIDGKLNSFAPSGLTSYTIPSSITTIGELAFYLNTNLESVELPQTLTNIENDAFYACEGLTSINIPEAVKVIGSKAFGYCNGLRSIYANPIIPPELGDYCFGFDKSACTLYVPAKSINAYKSASQWEDFTNVSAIAQPSNYLNAEKATTTKDKELSIPINLTNEAAISAFQCDIVLPAGLEVSIVEDEYDFTLSSRATRSHTISSNLVDTQTIRVLCYSNKSSAFTGTDGEIFRMPINPVAEPGNYNIIVKSIVLTDCTGAEYQCDDFVIPVEVKAFTPADANGDGEINVTDVVFTTNFILGDEPEGFVPEAADFNADGNVNVADVVCMINVILESSEPTESETANSVLKEDAVTSMYANDFSVNSGETKEFDVVLDNPDFALTAFQFNMTLPKGLSIVEEDGDFYIDQTSRATRSHTVSASLNNGIYTVIDYSSKSSNFSGNSGAVLTITVKADADFAGGELEIYNVVTTESNGTEHKLDATTATVTNPSGIDTIYAPQGEAKYYNLLGIPVNGTPETGVYIEVRDGVSRKVFVK